MRKKHICVSWYQMYDYCFIFHETKWSEINERQQRRVWLTQKMCDMHQTSEPLIELKDYNEMSSIHTSLSHSHITTCLLIEKMENNFPPSITKAFSAWHITRWDKIIYFGWDACLLLSFIFSPLSFFFISHYISCKWNFPSVMKCNEHPRSRTKRK